MQCTNQNSEQAHQKHIQIQCIPQQDWFESERTWDKFQVNMGDCLGFGWCQAKPQSFQLSFLCVLGFVHTTVVEDIFKKPGSGRPQEVQPSWIQLWSWALLNHLRLSFFVSCQDVWKCWVLNRRHQLETQWETQGTQSQTKGKKSDIKLHITPCETKLLSFTHPYLGSADVVKDVDAIVVAGS